MTIKLLTINFTILFSVFYINTNAQISISHPLERMIFQRNNSNQANINIAGTYYSSIDRVEARVVALQGGTTTSWTVIQTNPTNGYFSGTLLVTGGWYQLEVKAFKNSILIDTKIVQKVGVGEVFAIAGQSNAQGGAGVSTPATDDRVNSVNYSNDYSNYNKLPIGFSKMVGDSGKIGPFHYVPWAWGKLGDSLASRLNVPILFYGAAHGGTSSEHWGKSAQNLPFNGEFFILQELGAPYRALENCVAYYGSLTGLRGILWHQGESDRFTDLATYYNNVKHVIAKSRENGEHNTLAWVVARVSMSNNTTYEGPILGQNALISGFNNDPNYLPVPHVFAGPNTDLISGSANRTDGTHFDTYAGQIEFANAWNASLDNTFFSNSIPMTASPLLSVSLSCNPSNASTPISLSVAGGYSKYAWSNRQNTAQESMGISNNANKRFYNYPPVGYEALNWRTLDSVATITVSSARFAANVRKPSRKTLFSPVIDLTVFSLPTNPTFSTSAAQVRPNESLTLTGASCNGSYLWSTGANTNPLTFAPISTAAYTIQCKTLHCISLISATQTVTVSSCFPNSLSLNGSVSSLESAYASKQSIQSIQKVQLSGKVDYNAKTKVELLPGFEAKSGSVFRAFILGCN
ncbi:3-coathanger stack domain-containing protein [Emticicia sp.]|uniref:3-coathanger stack domain-containing protein n=1 Tax=Emticicia sp. TaxID=1930953 RepID=UPI00375350CB